MEINQVTQMIIEFAPVITALIGILVSLIIGIRKIKNSNDKTYTEIKLNNDNVVNELKARIKNTININDQRCLNKLITSCFLRQMSQVFV